MSWTRKLKKLGRRRKPKIHNGIVRGLAGSQGRPRGSASPSGQPRAGEARRQGFGYGEFGRGFRRAAEGGERVLRFDCGGILSPPAKAELSFARRDGTKRP